MYMHITYLVSNSSYNLTILCVRFNCRFVSDCCQVAGCNKLGVLVSVYYFQSHPECSYIYLVGIKLQGNIIIVYLGWCFCISLHWHVLVYYNHADYVLSLLPLSFAVEMGWLRAVIYNWLSLKWGGRLGSRSPRISIIYGAVVAQMVKGTWLAECRTTE